MINIQGIRNRYSLTKLIGLIILIVLLLSFSSISEMVNKGINNTFRLIAPTSETNSNIVIISIDENDIQKLGGWPLKRSYYALLINRLSEFSPGKIGIEVFLSDNVSMPAMYNKLLIDEIEKSGNVVLASLAGEIENDDGYKTDKIELPLSLSINENIQTGYINYTENGYKTIPVSMDFNGKKVYAFSKVLSGMQTSAQELVLNFNHPWRNFNVISLVELFEMFDKGDTGLQSLKDKTILIGVTDPAIAKTFATYYDDQLPGVALHAFAVENLMTDNGFNLELFTISAILFILILIPVELLEQNKIRIRALVILALYIISFGLFLLFNLQLNYAYFVLPLLLLIAGDLIREYLSQSRQLESSMNDLEIINAALRSKETLLKNLEKELEIASENESILEKINSLKSEIAGIEKSKQDEEISDEAGSEEVRDFFGMIYKSRVMRNVVTTVEKVAPQDATVLILGESGSGKELIANAIHQISKRSNNKFVAVNCAALTSSLLESELFGHVKGAFTNAVADKKGMFEAADKGTIFLDEIGETDENFQVKLLRVLQSGELQKVGSNEVKHVDVRVVAATNKDLRKLVEEKRFREDLYYRLNVININLPPLRERKEDVPVIAEYFAAKEGNGLKVSKAVMDQLIKQEWKGNVRELESAIKRASIFAQTEDRNIIKLGDLPESLSKVDRSDLEHLILDSLRQKKFSHSSINDTGKELGNISRTIVSENLRGIFFKHYFLSEFDFEKTVSELAGSDDKEVKDKVRSKAETYLKNIRRDLENITNKDFEQVKVKFNSKYKNLPQKYHRYLDEVIKEMIV